MAIAQTQPFRATSIVASTADRGRGRKSRIDPAVGNNVRVLRERIGWLQSDLAKAANVATGTVSGLESGRNTRADRIAAIATALGVSVEQLRTGALPDPADRFRDLSDEDLRIAREFHNATTGVRVAVAYALKHRCPEFTDRLLALDPIRQHAVIYLLEQQEIDQREADSHKLRLRSEAGG